MKRGRRVLTILIIIWTLTVNAFDSFPPGPTVQHEHHVHFYRKECPPAREIIKNAVLEAIDSDRQLPAALLRLNFHDCFVRGCDASILLDSNFSNIAEKDGVGNLFSIRGYTVIDAAKALVEAVCPKTVSCADIVVLAARDAIASSGGPGWRVVSGRRDGIASHAKETIRNLPPAGSSDFDVLTRVFAAKNLTAKDMVVLAGAHTMGNTHCGLLEPRLYNNPGPDGVDPTLDPTYAAELKILCPYRQTFFKAVALNPTNGNHTFNNNYFKIIQQRMGLFKSDVALISNVQGRALVALQSSSSKRFFSDFAAAMEKMINIEVLRAPLGEIRTNCRHVN